MREREILRKKAELQKLEEARQRTTKKIGAISHDIRRLEQTRRRQKILSAGKILDRAGVLDTFNADKLYNVLIENRGRICDMADEYAPYSFEY